MIVQSGSGKTYIAVMLIRWIMMQAYDQRKVIVFLAPKGLLVSQQAAFIKEQTGLEVCAYYGRTFDIWDRSQWRNEFQDVDVLAMTRKTPI